MALRDGVENERQIEIQDGVSDLDRSLVSKSLKFLLSQLYFLF